ncbi:hypothetical protein Bca52824_036874 [Brassica carinata]|uniref:Pentatricopeptide repeat-containing protein n=1 Tax=Brassica carinata TaxID=52824 RepID=A0A8X7S656_BRACI|nr:hypothetical protein Bca52824_036874 [Brassica carinata]
MRYQQWRLMLLRSYRASHLPHPSSSSQVTSISTRSISSLIHSRPGTRSLQQSQDLSCLRPPITIRSFSSDPAVKKEKSASEATVIDIFTRSSCEDEIKKELDSSEIVLTQDLALKVLRKLESNPDVAKRFFKWVKEASPGEEDLTSKSYNMMLRILGGNGLVDEFWGLVSSMKRKGHGLSANVRDKVGEKFQKDGLLSDYIRLKKLFPLDPSDDDSSSAESVCVRVCRIVEKEEWSDDVEKQIRDLNVEFGSDLVEMIVESLDGEPRKALLFFRWVDESGLFKHDERTYNAVARVLGREKFLDRFQNVIGEMKSAGYEVEIETYVTVSTRFCQSKLVEEAVDLFEIAVAGSNKPTSHCFSLLLKRIVTAKVLDMELFSRAVEAYTKNDNVLTDALLKSVLKSLTSIDRVAHSNEVLKAMKKGGYLPSSDLQSMIASGLSRKGKKDEADELVDFMEESGKNLDDNAMASLVVGYCVSGDLKEALVSFEKMVSKEGVSYADYAFEKLVHAYCNKNQSKLVEEAVDLFEIAVAGSNKPTSHCFSLLLKRIVTAKVLDMELFSRAVEAYTKNDNVLTDALLKSVLKSLTSIDRVAHSNEVLKAMKKGGYLPSSDLQSMIASGLSRKGKKDEADELVDFMEESGKNLDDNAMASLVVGYCVSGDLKEALVSFEKMVSKEGVSYADYAFEKLVHAYCNKNQVRVAYKLLCAHVKQNQLKPLHTTYKCLVSNLLTKKIVREGGFEEALSLLPIMKDQGFPPFVDPFMNHFSKTGTSSEAYSFLKALTSYHFPSISVVMRVFERMMKSARHSEAQDLLSLCPDYIRNDPDVLELFYSMKPNESAVEEPLAASS